MSKRIVLYNGTIGCAGDVGPDVRILAGVGPHATVEVYDLNPDDAEALAADLIAAAKKAREFKPLVGRVVGEHAAAISHFFPCSPCPMTTCIRPHDTCMQSITIEEVLRETDKLVGGSKAHAASNVEYSHQCPP